MRGMDRRDGAKPILTAQSARTPLGPKNGCECREIDALLIRFQMYVFDGAKEALHATRQPNRQRVAVSIEGERRAQKYARTTSFAADYFGAGVETTFRRIRSRRRGEV